MNFSESAVLPVGQRRHCFHSDTTRNRNAFRLLYVRQSYFTRRLFHLQHNRRSRVRVPPFVFGTGSGGTKRCAQQRYRRFLRGKRQTKTVQRGGYRDVAENRMTTIRDTKTKTFDKPRSASFKTFSKTDSGARKRVFVVTSFVTLKILCNRDIQFVYAFSIRRL